MKHLFLSLLALIAAGHAAGAMDISATSCEMLHNPLCVERESVRFGWQLRSDSAGDRQAAYRIIVASSRASIGKYAGNVWDSRRVRSADSRLVPYAGAPLERGARYYWRVMVWDKHGKASAWSEIGTFDVAPLISGLNVRWIGAVSVANSHLPDGHAYNPPFEKFGFDTLFNAVAPLAKRSIALRKTFATGKRVKRAMAYVAGLGHYELRINGRRAGRNVLAPLWSRYDKTIYYNAYDVTDLISPADNAIGVTLGNGFYNMAENARYRKLMGSFGPPTLFLRLQLDYADGTHGVVESDRTWKFAASPTTWNSIYGGESYDARMEQDGWDLPDFDDSSWLNAVVQESPAGRLRPQLAPPVKAWLTVGVQRTVSARAQPETCVLDMGQSLAAIPTIRVQGRRGQTLRLYPAERLGSDSLANQAPDGKPFYFEYTLRGDSVEEWTPRYSYCGFRYLQVAGARFGSATSEADGRPALLSVSASAIGSSADEAGTFECSDERLNSLHRRAVGVVRRNMQAVFTHSPNNDKLGHAEQSYLGAPGMMFGFDLAQLLPKTVRDLADAQWPSGMVPSIAPDYTTFIGRIDFSDSPEWGAAIAAAPWMYYLFYGDSTLVARYFTAMRRYVNYLSMRADGNIVAYGLGDWLDDGSNPNAGSRNTPAALSATAHYYAAARLTARAAQMLGQSHYAARYAALADNIRWAFNTKFFDPDSKQYGSGSQASNAIPLYMGIVEPHYRQAVLDNIIADIQAHGNRFTTGCIGSPYLLRVLADCGYNDVVYALLHRENLPEYACAPANEWLFRTVAGIAPDTAAAGFRRFIVAPAPVGDLRYAKATYRSPYGPVTVGWTSADSLFCLRLSVPVGAEAVLDLPDLEHPNISLNATPIAASPLAHPLSDGRYLIAGGSYVVEMRD